MYTIRIETMESNYALEYKSELIEEVKTNDLKSAKLEIKRMVKKYELKKHYNNYYNSSTNIELRTNF
jgi:hypothetical protein